MNGLGELVGENLDSKAAALQWLLGAILDRRPQNSFVVKIGRVVAHFNADCFDPLPLFKSERS